LRDAVIAGLQVDLTYAPPAAKASRHRLHPYGLVSKSGVWYLVAGADSELRTFRVSRVTGVGATTEAVERPDGFDLVRAWEDVARRTVPCWRSQVQVEFQVRAEDLGRVASALPEDAQLRPIDGKPGAAPRFTATFTSVHEAACELIYLGDGVQVLEPASVRAELVRIGHRLIAAHTPKW
jgi:predicted DNA-binding transcriptional regulator YafY